MGGEEYNYEAYKQGMYVYGTINLDVLRKNSDNILKILINEIFNN